ncbi:XRE family transcriptional regulator [bacterium D16-51]|nr:XRE family transcriptional regulator [bacterium D16-59]RKI54410.1 XRE family transcriptional regulator [bacterium D16-51]
MNIGLIITNLLDKHEISQKAFATALDVTESTVSMWKQQKRKPNIVMIKKIAIYFDVSTDYLLGMPKNNYTYLSNEKETITDEKTQNILTAFAQLSDDNKDIAIGEVKKILKEQRLENAFSK